MRALLTECRERMAAEHRHWLLWLDHEFGWSDDTARNFMQAYDMAKSRNFRDLPLRISSIYRLAAHSTPVEVRTEIFDRLESGEHLNDPQIRDLIRRRKAKPTKRALAELVYS
jgi:hypothetical protein